MKKIVTFTLAFFVMTALCSLLCLSVSAQSGIEAEEATLREALEKESGKEIAALYFDDFDADGTSEAFAIMADRVYDEEVETEVYGNVQIWFANTDKCSMVYESKESGIEINGVYEFSEGKLFIASDYYTTGSMAHFWRVKDGDFEYLYTVSGKGCFVKLENNTLIMTDSAYDGGLDSALGASLGHSWKPYYFYWDETVHKFFEYGGMSVSEEQLLRLKGADEVVSRIHDSDYHIVNIYYRDNGVVNIFYINDNGGHRDTTLVLNMEADEPYIESEETGEGIYMSAYIPEIATFPEKLPDVFTAEKGKADGGENTGEAQDTDGEEVPKWLGTATFVIKQVSLVVNVILLIVLAVVLVNLKKALKKIKE